MTDVPDATPPAPGPTAPAAPGPPYRWPLADLLGRLSDLARADIAATCFVAFGAEAPPSEPSRAKAPHPSVRSWPEAATPALTPPAAVELCDRYAAYDDPTDDGTLPGLALATGLADVVVIDVDDPGALEAPTNAAWADALRSAPTLTWTSVTRAHPHHVYRQSGDGRVGSGPIGHPTFGDVKGDGGYVVLANRPIPPDVPDRPAPLPPAVRAALAAEGRVAVTATATPGTAPAAPTPTPPTPATAPTPTPPAGPTPASVSKPTPTPASPTSNGNGHSHHTPSPAPAPLTNRAWDLNDVIDFYTANAPGGDDPPGDQEKRWRYPIARFWERVEGGEHRRTAALTMTRDLAIEIMAGIYDPDDVLRAAYLAYIEARASDLGHGPDDTPVRRADFVRMLADDCARIRSADRTSAPTADLLDAIDERRMRWDVEEAIDPVLLDILRGTPAPEAPQRPQTPVSEPPAPEPPSEPPKPVAAATAAPVKPSGPPSRPPGGDPPVLNDAAFHGPCGELALRCARHIEVAPAAVLTQALAYTGAWAGWQRTLSGGGSARPVTPWVVVVGRSALGRKGTSHDEVAKAFAPATSAPVPNRLSMMSGFGSGEILVDALVPDPANPGVARIVMVEAEYVGLLAATARKGSRLGQVLRNLFDFSTVETRSRGHGSLAVPVGSYNVAVIGHAVAEELLIHLDHAAVYGGTANRMLWVWSERPERRSFFAEVPQSIRDDFARSFAGTGLTAGLNGPARPLTMGTKATEHFDWTLRPRIENDSRVGLYAAATNRGPTLVARLAGCYAISRGSTTINNTDLDAAMAVWEYSVRTAGRLFGVRTGNGRVDSLVNELRSAYIDPDDSDYLLPWTTVVKRAGREETVDYGLSLDLLKVIKAPRSDGSAGRLARWVTLSDSVRDICGIARRPEPGDPT